MMTTPTAERIAEIRRLVEHRHSVYGLSVCVDLLAALDAALAKLAGSGFCQVHEPNPGRVYASCWVCSRMEESAKLAQAEALTDRGDVVGEMNVDALIREKRVLQDKLERLLDKSAAAAQAEPS